MEKETAMKILKELHDKSLFAERTALETLIPELAVSEDERIRKALIKGVESCKASGWTNFGNNVDIDVVLAWLEKQGTPSKLSEEEQNSFAKGVLSRCALSFINYLDAHRYEGQMCVSNGECEDIDYAFHNAMWDRLHRYYCKYIEKQGKVSVTINVDKMVRDYANNKERGNEEFGKPVNCMIRAYRQGIMDALEKQGNSSVKWQKNTSDNKPAIKSFCSYEDYSRHSRR